MSALLNFASRAGIAVATVGIVNEFFLYDGANASAIFFFSHFINFIFCLVEPGTCAVIFDKVRGIQDTSVGEGTHLRIPLIQVCRKLF